MNHSRIAEQCQRAVESARRGEQASRMGQSAVSDVLGGLDALQRETRAATVKIKRLGERSMQISAIIGTSGSDMSRVKEVVTSGPRTLLQRNTVTSTSRCLPSKSITEASASTMSRSIGVPGGRERSIVSVKKAGQSSSRSSSMARA